MFVLLVFAQFSNNLVESIYKYLITFESLFNDSLSLIHHDCCSTFSLDILPHGELFFKGFALPFSLSLFFYQKYLREFIPSKLCPQGHKTRYLEGIPGAKQTLPQKREVLGFWPWSVPIYYKNV